MSIAYSGKKSRTSSSFQRKSVNGDEADEDQELLLTGSAKIDGGGDGDNRLVKMSMVMEAPSTAGARPDKSSDNFLVDNSGDPETTTTQYPPAYNILFSDLIIKKSKTDGAHNYYHPDIEFSYKFEGPDIQVSTTAETSQRPGFVPLSTAFHQQSHRERLDEEDDGLDDEDLTAADGIIRTQPEDKNKAEMEQQRRASKRHSFIYEAIKLVKGDFLFPHRTYRPKVQVAYRVPPGQLPQAVVIERLHRIYKKADINVICQNLGITSYDLMAVPHYGETSERFYQEMQWRNRIRVNGVDKREFIDNYNKDRRKNREMMNLFSAIAEDPPPPQAQSRASKLSQSFDRDVAEMLRSRPRGVSHEETGENDDGEKLPQTKSEVSLDNSNRDLPPFGAMFPLDYFDNEEFDIRSGPEWMFLGWDSSNSKMYPIPAKAYLPMPKSGEKRTTKRSKCNKSQKDDDNPDDHKSLSELTSTNLLLKTERLEKFRRWLLGERYKRLKKSSVSNQIINEPDDEELMAFARATTTVPNLIKYAPDDSEQNIPSPSTTNGPIKTPDSPFVTGSAVSIKNLYSVEMTEELSNDSLSIIDLAMGQSDFLSQFKNTDEQQGQGKVDAPDGRTDLKRSESLLPDVFSDPDSLPISPDVLTAAKTSVKEMTSLTIGENGSNVVGKVGLVIIPDVVDVKKRMSSESEGLTLASNDPKSPDVDPYEDGYEDLVFDYEKMKRVHNFDWQWTEVAVFKYDEETRKYFVRTIFPPLIFAWVNKLYVLMDGEDPHRHGERLKDAIQRRYEVENLMRYNLYIDCLPMDRVKNMSSNFMTAIMTKVLSTPRLKYTDKTLQRIQTELDLEYQRTHLMLEFNSIVEKHSKLYQPWVKIPKPFINWGQGNEWKKFRNRQVDLGSFSYKKTRIQKLSVIYKKEPYEGLVNIVSLCMTAREKSLILHRRNFSLPLEEFERQQTENISQIMTYLKDDWMQSILETIRTNLGKIPHSWYNIKETRWDVYLMSKTSNYLNLVKYIMEDTLRYIIEGSLENFVGEIETLTDKCDVDMSYHWGEDLITSEFPPPEGMTPPFSLELFIDNDGPKYTQLLSKYPKMVSIIFESVITSSSTLPDVVPQIMTNLLFGLNRRLHAVELSETHIRRLKATLLRSIRKGLLPVDKYAQKYRRYQQIWNLDLIRYLRAYEKENHTVADVRKAVEQHTVEYTKLEEEIPSQVDITCFRVVTSVVKQNLLKKKKQLINGMLAGFADKLKQAVLKIRDDYQEMERKLNTRSDDIEEVMELKQYVDTVPLQVKTASELMSKLMKDYDMFEKFSYAVPNEDFEAKWNTAMWSTRILKMADEAVTWLDDDYDRLLKVQQADLSALSDAVDSSFLSVAGLAAFVELERAVEVAAEVKKLWKQVNELTEQNNLLNKRQKVFGLPLTQNEALVRLVRDIEPFKSLWFTAADWLRIQENVYKETLDKIDMRVVNKLINEGGQVIRRCVRYFKGADTIQHIAEEVRHQIEEFKKVVPLIQTLKNQGMRQRHWEAISDICGFTVVAKGNQNFKVLLDAGMFKHADKIEAIGTLATNEFAIENKLEKMLRDLSKLKIENIVDPSSGIVIIELNPPKTLYVVNEFLKATEELQQNPFRGPFDERLNTWEQKIQLTKENLVLWLENQDEWLNLQSSFSGVTDAATKMPNEHKMFVKMERIWRRLNRLVRDTPEILEIGSDATVRASLLQFSSLVKKLINGLEQYHHPKDSDSDDDDDAVVTGTHGQGQDKQPSIISS